MRFTLPLVFILLILCSQHVAHAQQKIGYTNLDLLLAYLPETQQVQYEIENFQKQVTKKLEAKKKYFDVKVEEYTEMAQQPGVTPAALAPLEKELEKLQEELRKSVEKSDRDLARKQSELMEPVIEKLEKE